MPKQYLPIGQAAEYLGKSIDTLRRWEKLGKITTKRLDGKNRYFAIVDLDFLKFGKTVNIHEAAKRLEISTSTLRRLADQKIIPGKREKNGYRIFLVKDLEHYLDSKINLAHEAQKIQIEQPVTTGGINPLKDKPKLYSLLISNFGFFRNIQTFWRTFIISCIVAAISFLMILTAITFAFVINPVGTAKFFHFDYKEIPDANISNEKILGITTNRSSSSRNIFGITTAKILQSPAKTSVQILRIFDPESGARIVIPEDGLVSVGVAGTTGEIGATGATGTTGQSGAIADNSIDVQKWSATSAMNAAKAITFGASTNTLTFTNDGSGNMIVNLSSTGDFDIQDNGTSAFYVNDSGNVGIGTTGPGAKLDVLNRSILLGADWNNTSLRTDATSKAAVFAGYHYTNANTAVNGLFIESGSNYNSVNLGGGTSTHNAATQVSAFTAANNNTVTGTERLRISSTGGLSFGSTYPEFPN